MLVRKTQAWEGGGREGDESNVREKASRRDRWRQGRNQRACVLCPNTNQNPDHMCVFVCFCAEGTASAGPSDVGQLPACEGGDDRPAAVHLVSAGACGCMSSMA